MRALMLTVAAGLAAFATAASAQTGDPRNDFATLCLDTLGVNHPPTCKTMSASRLASKPDICICPGPYMTVRAPWCAKGQKPPADSADFDRARYAAAQHGASLFGATYKGQPMCVPETVNGR